MSWTGQSLVWGAICNVEFSGRGVLQVGVYLYNLLEVALEEAGGGKTHIFTEVGHATMLHGQGNGTME